MCIYLIENFFKYGLVKCIGKYENNRDIGINLFVFECIFIREKIFNNIRL